MRWLMAFFVFLAVPALMSSCSQKKTERTEVQGEGRDHVWSTFLGGSGEDEGTGLAIDGHGDIYLIGWTQSQDFPTTSGAFSTTHHGGGDAFVVKIDQTDGHLVYSTLLGGGDWDEAFGITVDAGGHAYVTGRTRSADFPTRNAFDRTHGGSYDAFVTKLDPTGSKLSWSTFLGGKDYDRGNRIVVDTSGRAHIIGWTKSPDFPTSPEALGRRYHGHMEEDTFLAVINSGGDSLVYATYLGGDGEDWGNDIALDRQGHVVVAMLTDSPDLPTTAGAFDRTYNGSREAYIAKMDLWGHRLLSATYLGGSNQDWPQALLVGEDGCIHVVGVTFSDDFPIIKGDSTQNGFSDLFFATLDSSESTLLYSTFLGGADQERSTAMAIDDGQNLYLTGWTKSADFPTTPAASDTIYHGQVDGLVIALNPQKDGLLYSSFLGGSGSDIGYGLAIDGRGWLTVVGRTNSSDFPVTPGALFPTLAGDADAFVARFDVSLMRIPSR